MRPSQQNRLRVRETDTLQYGTDFRLCISPGTGHTGCRCGLSQLHADAHARIQRGRRILVHHGDGSCAEVAKFGRSESVHVLAIHHDPATRDPATTWQVAQRRVGDGRFPATGLSGQAEGLAMPDCEAEATYDVGVVPVGNTQPVDCKHLGHLPVSRSPSASRLQAITTDDTAAAGSSAMCG